MNRASIMPENISDYHACCAGCLPPAAHAAIDVIDRIDITRGVDESTIHIHLNIPVSYKLHVPEHSGDLLRIFVEPLPSPGAAADALLGRESIQWSAGQAGSRCSM